MKLVIGTPHMSHLRKHCRKFTHFSGVKFSWLKMRRCKKITNIRYGYRVGHGVGHRVDHRGKPFPVITLIKCLETLKIHNLGQNSKIAPLTTKTSRVGIDKIRNLEHVYFFLRVG